MKDIDLLTKLLGECETRLRRTPDFRPLMIVKEEVQYLVALMEGKTKDRSNLANIQIGLLAVREFEADDPEFAELIFQAADVVKKLR
ncbi:MAG: hypothetical protein HY941_08975 [Gammaproteobacteria bacterium]|nr:hypothetical protein [Gammaproteobacteria bacterium]